MKNGTISLESVDILEERISKMKKEEAVLNNHKHKVWFDEKKQGWYTTVEDPRRPKGLRLVFRKSRDDLIAFLNDFYRKKMETIEVMYTQWIAYRRMVTNITEQSLTKYGTIFNRFFADTDFENIPIGEITEDELTRFILTNIKGKKLTAKQFSDLRLVINGIFKFAKRNGKTDISISTFFADLDLNGMFEARPRQKEAYSDSEIKQIVDTCYKINTCKSLIVAFVVQISARVSESIVCRWSDADLEKGKLKIDKTAVIYKDPETEGKRIHLMQNRAKSEAGRRELFLTDNAIVTLRKLQNFTGEFEYICMDPRMGHYMSSNSVRYELRKICKKAGVPYRATHAARATMATDMIEANIPDSLIQKHMGHADIMTTRKYYNKNRTEEKEMRTMLNRAIGY